VRDGGREGGTSDPPARGIGRRAVRCLAGAANAGANSAPSGRAIKLPTTRRPTLLTMSIGSSVGAAAASTYGMYHHHVHQQSFQVSEFCAGAPVGL